MITSPVWYSYSPLISSAVIRRVQGWLHRSNRRAWCPRRGDPARPVTRWSRGASGYAQCHRFRHSDGRAPDALACRTRAFCCLPPLTAGYLNHHHIVGGHHVVLDAGRFDYHPLPRFVYRADIAPGERHQMVSGKRQIRRQHVGFQLL